MSVNTILADLSNDLQNWSTEGKAAVAALLSRITALEGAVKTSGDPLASALAEITTDVTGALSAGASVAAAATNPTAAVIAIGAQAVPVTSMFVDAYNEAKGFLEGLTDQQPAAGASPAEQTGDAAGAAVRNIFDAIVDSIEGKTPPPVPSVGTPQS